MKKDERLHIESVGEGVFSAALAKATIRIREDRRLTGLDKVREPLAYEAALRATGFAERPFSLAKKRPPHHARVSGHLRRAFEMRD